MCVARCSQRRGDLLICQVALKLLGQHAEPQHINYLLSCAPRKSLGDLHLEQIITYIMGTDIRLTLPLQTVEKLKEVVFFCLGFCSA